jgi:hypothetical protein
MFSEEYIEKTLYEQTNKHQDYIAKLVYENDKKFAENIYKESKSDLKEFIKNYYDKATIIDIPDEPYKKILLARNHYTTKGDSRQFDTVAKLQICSMKIDSYLEDVDKREVALTYESYPYETPRVKYRYINMEFTIPERKNKYENLIIEHLGGHHVYINTPHEFQVSTDCDWRGGPLHYLFGFVNNGVYLLIDTQHDRITSLNYYIVSLKYTK